MKGKSDDMSDRNRISNSKYAQSVGRGLMAKAVLVAIAIPVFTAQLEKSRESTDAANIRNAYAEIIVDILDNPGGAHTHDAVAMMQRQAGWQNAEVPLSLQNLGGGGTTYDGDLEITVTGEPTGSESATTTFTYTAGTADANPTLTITIG